MIIQNGLERMYQRRENCFYYITAMNENYQHPGLPAERRDEVVQGIIKGMYLLHPAGKKATLFVQLMGCGSILREVEAAAEILAKEFGVQSDVWSLTSINELRKEGLETARWNRLHPQEKPRSAFVTQQLQQRFDQGFSGPVIIATDYIKLFGDQLREFIPEDLTVLGTDGFGRSDTREKLRRHFEVDRYHIAASALHALMRQGKVGAQAVQDAMARFGISPEKSSPVKM